MRKIAVMICCSLTLGVGVLASPRPTMCVTMSIITVTAYHHCPGSKGITSSGAGYRWG